MRNLQAALTRFLGRARAIRKERALAPTVSVMEREVADVFRAQGAALMKRLAGARDKWPTSTGPAQEAAGSQPPFPGWDDMFDDMADETEGLWLMLLRRRLPIALLAGAEEARLSGLLTTGFNLKNPRAVAYMAEHGAELITRINGTTRDVIHGILNEGASSGWSYDKMAAAIIDKFEEFAVGKPQAAIETRAHLVAVTEAGEAFENGNFIPIQDMQASGLEMEKSWNTVGDDRVSDGCQENQDQGWIPLNQPHASGHQHPLRFPG